MLKEHWAVLGSDEPGYPGDRHWVVPRPWSCAASETVAPSLRDDGRPSPWTGTVTTVVFSSLNEIQRRVTQAIEKSSYSWPPVRLLPMLPNEGPIDW
jgi:hypothetical protein